MGCHNLTYQDNQPVLRVLHRKSEQNEKSSAGVYRYGFQGQETDDEWLSGGVAFKYRIHDARLGRFLSVDPLTSKFAFNGPYNFSENSVIAFVELEGLEKVYFGYNDKDMIQINKMTADQVRNEFESRGLNFDSDWYDKNANANEIWRVREGSDGWGHSTGTYIQKYNSEASYKGGSGESYDSDVDRTFCEWLYAKDASMTGRDGMKEGLTFAVGVAGIVVSGGSILLAEGAMTAYQGVSLVLAFDGLTNINDENSLLESAAEHIGGEQGLALFQGAKLAMSVHDGAKSLINISMTLVDGKTVTGTWDVANEVFTTINTGIDGMKLNDAIEKQAQKNKSKSSNNGK